jgi:hypothetical protein
MLVLVVVLTGEPKAKSGVFTFSVDEAADVFPVGSYASAW